MPGFLALSGSEIRLLWERFKTRAWWGGTLIKLSSHCMIFSSRQGARVFPPRSLTGSAGPWVVALQYMERFSLSGGVADCAHTGSAAELQPPACCWFYCYCRNFPWQLKCLLLFLDFVIIKSENHLESCAIYFSNSWCIFMTDSALGGLIVQKTGTSTPLWKLQNNYVQLNNYTKSEKQK